MWKLGVSAAVAIRLIRAARPCIRPNVGFVRQVIFDRDVSARKGAREAASRFKYLPGRELQRWEPCLQHHVVMMRIRLMMFLESYDTGDSVGGGSGGDDDVDAANVVDVSDIGDDDDDGDRGGGDHGGDVEEDGIDDDNDDRCQCRC